MVSNGWKFFQIFPIKDNKMTSNLFLSSYHKLFMSDYNFLVPGLKYKQLNLKLFSPF